MKVKCPSCKADYQIDTSRIAEIPKDGFSVTCPKCKKRVLVKLKTKKEEHQEEIVPCPNCGHVNISSKLCVSCGTVFSEEEKEKLAIKLDSED